MRIEEYKDEDGKKWNDFIAANFPPVGAFIQSFEWGEFQRTLGRPVWRFFINNGAGPIAAFTLIRFNLLFGLKYGYSPRGPVLALAAQEANS